MNRASLPADRVLWLAGSASLAAMAGALGFQYLAGFPPCEMCHWQRWPYLAAALLGFVITPLWKGGMTMLVVVVVALASICGLIAAYQWDMLNGLVPDLLAIAIVGLLVVPLWIKDARLLAMIAIALIAISGLIGAYQTGLQWHLLPGPSACTASHPYIMGSNAPPPVVRCDVPSWLLFGLSLAAYNAIFSLLVAGTAATLLTRRR